MPLFTPWAETDPFPNVLFNPAAVDQAVADTQSKLGDLDIKRQTLGLEYQKLAQQRAAGAALLGGGNTNTATDRSSTTTDGSSPAAGGGGSFLDNLASIESGDQNIVSRTDTDSKGLTLAQGGNPAEISQGHFQIQTATWRDFAKQAGVDTNQASQRHVGSSRRSGTGRPGDPSSPPVRATHADVDGVAVRPAGYQSDGGHPRWRAGAYK